MTFKGLYIEDQRPELYIDILKQYNGIDWQVATNGIDAIELVRSKRFDIILCDIRLPHINGFQIIREARKHSTNVDTPIIAFSAYTDKTTRQRSLEAGADVFVSKVTDYGKLYVKILRMAVARSVQYETKSELDILKQTLSILRTQAALHGGRMHAPAHIQVQIENLETEILELEEHYNNQQQQRKRQRND